MQSSNQFHPFLYIYYVEKIPLELPILMTIFPAVLEHFVVSIASRLEACGQVWVAFVLSLLLRRLLWLHFEAPPLSPFCPSPTQSDQMGHARKFYSREGATLFLLFNLFNCV